MHYFNVVDEVKPKTIVRCHNNSIIIICDVKPCIRLEQGCKTEVIAGGEWANSGNDSIMSGSKHLLPELQPEWFVNLQMDKVTEVLMMLWSI